MARILLLALMFALAAPAVRAQAPGAPAEPGEEIRLQLTAEDWVATETAGVEMAADLTLVGQDPAKLRAEVAAALERIEDAPWRITQFARGADPSGAERWSIRAEARIPQVRLDSLAARARGESGAGKAFRVARIDTAPSLAEREAALRGLRERLYGLAREELEAAKALWPDRGARILRVEFVPSGFPMPRPEPYMARQDMAQGVAAAEAGTVTERKVSLSAWVTLAPAR